MGLILHEQIRGAFEHFVDEIDLATNHGTALSTRRKNLTACSAETIATTRFS